MGRTAVPVATGLALSGVGAQDIEIQDLSQFASGVIYITAPDASGVTGVTGLNLTEVDPVSGQLVPHGATISNVGSGTGPGSEFHAAAEVSGLTGIGYQFQFNLSGTSPSGTFSVTFVGQP